MMKCYYSLSAPGKKVIVNESHYKDDEAFWTTKYMLTVASSSKSNPNEDEKECFWFERTRVAIFTDRRSIYVTEGETGGLEYDSFNYNDTSDRASTSLEGGVRTFDRAKNIETFTFEGGGYSYVVNVSANDSRPFVEVLVKKNGALLQRERCLSYTYLKKS